MFPNTVFLTTVLESPINITYYSKHNKRKQHNITSKTREIPNYTRLQSKRQQNRKIFE